MRTGIKTKTARRDFLRGAAGAVAALGLWGCRPAGQHNTQTKHARDAKIETGKNKPNIIIIMADDLSAMQLGCYGNSKNSTPNLDRLAAEGIKFETCWATPVCSPSRAIMYTGKYAYRTGWYHNDLKPSQPLYENHITLPQPLKKAGYRTAFCGKWQMPGSPYEFGFDEYIKNVFFPAQQEMPVPVGDDGRYSYYWHPALIKNDKVIETNENDYAPDIAADFVTDFAAADRDKPFFIFYSMWLPHVAYDQQLGRWGYPSPPATDENGNRIPGKNLKGNAERTLEGQGTLVEYIDILVGRILNSLERNGSRSDTVIMFTADNGAPQYGKNRVDREKGPRVPLIVNCPGRVQQSGSSMAMISFADFMPTVIRLAEAEANVPEEYKFDGVSFAGILEGRKVKTRDYLYSNFGPWQMLRDERWLLDAAGTFWDTHGRRDEVDYKDVTNSFDPEVKAAKKRFEKYLERYPVPDENTVGWDKWQNSQFRPNIEKRIKQIQAAREK